MRNNHDKKTHKLGKRTFALCLALAVICSCLLPVFATGNSDAAVMLPEDGGIAMPVAGDDSGAVVQPGGGEIATPVIPGDGEGTASSGSESGSTPVTDPSSVKGVTFPEGATNIVKNPNGSYSYDTAYGRVTVFPDADKADMGDGTVKPNPNMKEDDAAFGVLPITYHFWLKKMDSFDLDDLTWEAEMANLSETEYLSLYGSSKKFPIWHMDTISADDVMGNYTFNNPTSLNDPEGKGREFAGWYTVDSLGVESEFEFYKSYGDESNTTINVFAKWKDASGDVVEEPKTDDTKSEETKDETKQEETKADDTKKNETAKAALTAEAALPDTSAKATVTVEGMPASATHLSVTTMGDTSMENFYNLYTELGGKLMPLMGFKITPKDASGATVQPNGYVTVTISGLGGIGLETLSGIKVLHQTIEHKVETLDALYDSATGTLTFLTNSFSPFVIAMPKEVATLDLNGLTVSIRNDVEKDGKLYLKVKDSATGEEVTAAALKEQGAEIKWYKNNVEIERQIIGYSNGSDYYNMDADGSWINVGATEGSGCTYKVIISKDSDTLTVSSVTIDDYNTKVENGDFENPLVDSNEWWGNYQGSVDNWKTTSNGDKIEIANVTYKYGRNDGNGRLNGVQKTVNAFGCDTTAHGDQFAELNAEGKGTLYQDVIVNPGKTMNWQFFHRMRKFDGVNKTYLGNNSIPSENGDTMVMIIGPLEWAKTVTNQDDINTITAQYVKDGWYTFTKGSDQYKVYMVKHTTHNQSGWDNVYGSIQIPENWGVVRFFFGAVDTGSKNQSVGNLLDYINFSTEPNAIPAGSGQITITKKIYGLTLDEVKNNLSGKKFISYNGSKSGDITFTDSDWYEATDASGNPYIWASKTIGFDDVDESGKKLTFSEDETKAFVSGYALVSAWDNNSNSASIGRKDTENTGYVSVTNTYTRNTANLTVSKTVTGLLGDHHQQFTFQIVDDKGNPVALTTDNFVVNGDADTTKVALVDDGKDGKFTLVSGASVTIKNLAGSYTVKELDGTGYETKWQLADGAETAGTDANVTMSGTNQTLNFTNKRTIDVDTGVILDTLPYIVILAVVVGGGVMLFLRKRRKDDED